MTPSEFPVACETVWFKVPGSAGVAPNCAVWDRRGWHLGWWDGTFWRSYVAGHPIKPVDVTAWAALRLPDEERLPVPLARAVRRELDD